MDECITHSHLRMGQLSIANVPTGRFLEGMKKPENVKETHMGRTCKNVQTVQTVGEAQDCDWAVKWQQYQQHCP